VIDILKLVEKCIERDEEAWTQFVKIFSSMAYKILGRFSNLVEHHKEDVIQNAFKKLLESGLTHFKGTTKYEFLKYFKTIVTNEAITYIKTVPKWNQIEEIDEPIDDHSPPEEIAHRKLILEKVVEILKTFDFHDQQLFLYKLEGYKDKEISQYLKIPMGTVASRYSRMIDKIRTELKKSDIITKEDLHP